MLEFDPATRGFKRDKDNPLPYEWISYQLSVVGSSLITDN
jgi:hypothetical protein